MIRAKIYKKATDRSSNFPTAKVFSGTSSDYIAVFIDGYIFIHIVPRIIRLVQARNLIRTQFRGFCNKHNINVIASPLNDHYAIV